MYISSMYALYHITFYNIVSLMSYPYSFVYNIYTYPPPHLHKHAHAHYIPIYTLYICFMIIY